MSLPAKRPFQISQNFLHSPSLVEDLLAKTNIMPEDVVYDIGAGKGILAAALAARAHKVIAIEVDPAIVDKLRINLAPYANTKVYQDDFLQMALPPLPYKVFANIPFNQSADILHKLLDNPNPPLAAYLIVQKEFAQKLISEPGKYNSQLAVLTGVSFEVKIIERLRAKDFQPRPRVDPVFMAILQRSQPLVAKSDLQLFRDFVVYAYTAFKPILAEAVAPIFSSGEFAQAAKDLDFSTTATPSQLYLEQWLGLFAVALKRRAKLEKLVAYYEQTLAQKHSERTKLNRTRQKTKKHQR